jgi:hypothetical protein
MEEIAFIRQSSLRIEVRFYDDEQRRRLASYPTTNKLEEIVRNGVTVPTAEFLTYYLFHKKRPGKLGYRGYVELGRKMARALNELEEWGLFVDGTLRSSPDAVPQDRVITERVGEAAALCLVNDIHHLHEADWDKIPEHPGKNGFATFDYQYPMSGVEVSASDGERIIQVEAKGTAVRETSELTASVRTHKANIDGKKHRIWERERKGLYPYPAAIRYGIITSLGVSGPLRCWLLDPPIDGEAGPRRMRLLTRLRFLFDLLSFLMGRSQLAASIATRLAALHALDDPFVLDGIPLLRGNGEPFEVRPFDSFRNRQGFFANMTHVVDAPVGGVLMKLDEGHFFFLGIRESLVIMAVKQMFERMLEYDEACSSESKELHCVVSRSRARRMEIEGLDTESRSDSAHIRFFAKGQLHYSRGGIVFGVVRP